MQRDHVHIAFGDDRVAAFGAALTPGGARRRPAIEHASLVEERAVGRVQVFGLPLTDDPAAKGDHPPGAVADRKHDPTAEIIERLAGFGAVQQPRLHPAAARQNRRRGRGAAPAGHPPPSPAESGGSSRGRARAPADSRAPARRPGTTAGPRKRPRRLPTFRARSFAAAPARAPAGVACGTASPASPASFSTASRKSRLLGPHHKADRIAMRAAAEAVEEGLVLDHVEGRRLLVVERAQASVLAPAAGQLDPAADQTGERNAPAQLVEKSRRKGHRLRSPPTGKSVAERMRSTLAAQPSSRLTTAPARPKSIAPAWRSRSARHDLAHVADAGGAGLGDRRARGGGDLLVAHLARQKAFDDRDLVTLLLGEVGAVARS